MDTPDKTNNRIEIAPTTGLPTTGLPGLRAGEISWIIEGKIRGNSGTPSHPTDGHRWSGRGVIGCECGNTEDCPHKNGNPLIK